MIIIRVSKGMSNGGTTVSHPLTGTLESCLEPNELLIKLRLISPLPIEIDLFRHPWSFKSVQSVNVVISLTFDNNFN